MNDVDKTIRDIEVATVWMKVAIGFGCLACVTWGFVIVVMVARLVRDWGE